MISRKQCTDSILLDFTDHQRSVFCVFSGQGVVGLRNHLNGSERQPQGMHLAMRAGPPGDLPIFPAGAGPPPAAPQLNNVDDGLGEADAVDDDDGLDGSEMVIDAQPLLNHHNIGLAISQATPGAIPVPPPIPPAASHAHPANVNPFGYVGGHPPYVPHQMLSQPGSAGLTPSTSPPHAGQDEGNDDMDISPASAIASSGFLQPPPAQSAPQFEPTPMVSTNAASAQDIGTIPNQPDQHGTPGPAQAAQGPGCGNVGGS